MIAGWRLKIPLSPSDPRIDGNECSHFNAVVLICIHPMLFIQLHSLQYGTQCSSLLNIPDLDLGGEDDELILSLHSPFFVTNEMYSKFLDFAAIEAYNQGHVLSFNLTADDSISSPGQILRSFLTLSLSTQGNKDKGFFATPQGLVVTIFVLTALIASTHPPTKLGGEYFDSDVFSLFNCQMLRFAGM